jgi:hypothetical protein
MAFSNQKELSIAIIVIVVLIMVFKPSILGIMYNNILGKLFLVACIVFLTLKHTIAGLLGVVFIAVIASNSVFEGNTNKKEEEEEEDKPAAMTTMTTTKPEAMENEKKPTNVNLAAAQALMEDYLK